VPEDAYPLLLAQVRAWQHTGHRPDRGVATDAFVQEEVRRRRLEARVAALRGLARPADDELAIVETQAAEAGRRARTARLVLAQLDDPLPGQVEDELEAVRMLKTKELLRSGDRSRLDDASGARAP
jgi:hypothetical protein